jgi:hypothetical protein
MFFGEDYDGDGRSELTIDRSSWDEASLEVIRVSDGRTLWRDDAEGEGYYWEVGDLDGDRGADLLRHLYTWTWDETSDHVASDVTAMRGATGTTLWGISAG